MAAHPHHGMLVACQAQGAIGSSFTTFADSSTATGQLQVLMDLKV
jgi:hypothetical protein